MTNMNGRARNAANVLGIGLLVGACAAFAADNPQKASPPSTPAAANTATVSPAAPSVPAVAPSPAASAETGLAAVYSKRLSGHKTANGERYDPGQLTAAHKTLAFGTQVKVTNVQNHKSVTVRINDRGPTQNGRILDISAAAAKQLGIRPTGMAEVSAEVMAK